MDRSILVVDDIAANRNLLGETLEPKGYEVLLAANGAMALKVAARARPNLILMDEPFGALDALTRVIAYRHTMATYSAHDHTLQ